MPSVQPFSLLKSAPAQTCCEQGQFLQVLAGICTSKTMPDGNKLVPLFSVHGFSLAFNLPWAPKLHPGILLL